jgi:transcriptional regulator with XRE-family HTH domain
MSSTKCRFFLLFLKNSRKLNMETKGWTLEELADKLGLSKNTTQQRIKRAKIEPIFRGSLYPPDTLDRIQEAPMGRPPKAKPEAPAKAAGKPKK